MIWHNLDSFHVGTRFYKWSSKDKNPTVLRLIGKFEKQKSYDEDKYIFLHNGKKIVCSGNSFNDVDYKILNPDGFITISRDVDPETKDVEDIIITFNRMEYRIGKDTSLFAICRQSYQDIYISNAQIHPALGMSISIEDNQKLFVDMISNYKSIENGIVIAIYKDDTLDSILDLIDTTPFDNTLKKLKEKLESPNKKYPMGGSNCSTSIRELLESTYFMYSVYQGFNILYDPEFVIDEENNKVSGDIEEYIMDQLDSDHSLNYSGIYVLKYNLTIDMEEIQRRHVMVANDTGVYIIGYDTNEIYF